jgi:hypothetical protein
LLLQSGNQALHIKLRHHLCVPFGFFYNQGGSRGCFVLEGKNAIRKIVNSGLYSSDSKLVWARPIHSFVQPDDSGLIRIGIDPYAHAGDLEPTEFGLVPAENDVRESVLEIVSLVSVDLARLFGEDLAVYLFRKVTDLQGSLCFQSSRGSSLDRGVYLNSWTSLGRIRVAVLEGRARNLALNQVASQSSYYEVDSMTSHMGCNGVKTGRFSFHTALEKEPWWAVDLSRLANVTAIIIYNRMDSARDRAKSLRIYSSIDQTNWTRIYSHAGLPPFGGVDTEGLAPPLALEFDCVCARYIKMDLEGETYLHLDEVEVYGAFL